MKDVYKNIKNIGSMVCKRWSRWSFAKKKGVEDSVGKGFSVWMTTVVRRWSGGGHWWSGDGHKKCDLLQEMAFYSKKRPFYSKK